MNGYMLEARVREGLRDLRRARLRALAGVALAVALAVAAAASIALSVGSSAGEPVALALSAIVGAICFAVWGGRALRSMARLEQRIVGAVSAFADRGAPRRRTA